MKYIVWPTPATNTQNPTNVGYAYGSGYGTETGALSALTAVDNSYENLTESQQLTGTITGTPAKLSSDNTGATLSNLTASDGLYYAVQRASSGHNIMNISYSISSSNSAYAVNTATLWLEYYTANSGGGFTSSNLQWSLDGKTWTTITSVTTHASQTSMTYNLAINGVNTYAKLNNLIIRYQGGSMGTVNWNALLVNVTFVKTYALDWSWQIVNGASYATHSLTVNARCFDNSESFTLEYSVDNSTWQGQTTIFSTTAANYVWTLQAQSGSYYYLRVVDNNQGPSDTSASTLCINMISMAQTEAPYVGNGDIQVSFNSGASWIHTAAEERAYLPKFRNGKRRLIAALQI